jgi:hypothetical protein
MPWKGRSVTKTKPKLTTEQVGIIGQMNDLSFENRKLTFEQVVRKVGIKFKVSNGKAWEKECRAVFERERES